MDGKLKRPIITVRSMVQHRQKNESRQFTQNQQDNKDERVTRREILTAIY